MEGLGASLEKLKRFFLDVKNGTRPEDILSLENCEYYLSATVFLEQIVEFLSLRNAKYLISSSAVENDRKIMKSSAFQAVFQRSIELSEELEREKQPESVKVRRLESLVESLSAMLSEEKAAKGRIEERLQRVTEESRVKLDGLKERVNKGVTMIKDLEDKCESLQRQNSILSRKSGGSVELLNRELGELRREIERKTDKIRLLEEAQRMTLGCYAKEMNQLKEENERLRKACERTQVEVGTQTQNEVIDGIETLAAQVDLMAWLNQELLEHLGRRKQAMEEVLGIENESAEALVQRKIAELEEETAEQKDRIDRIKNDTTMRKNECGALAAVPTECSMERNGELAVGTNAANETRIHERDIQQPIGETEIGIAETRAELQNTDDQIRELELANLDGTEQLHAAESRLRDNRERLLKLRLEKEEIEKRISATTTDMEEATKQLAIADQNLELERKALLTKESDLSDIKQKICNQESQVAQVQQETLQLKSQIENGNKMLGTLECSLLETQNDCTELQNNLLANESKKSELESKIGVVKARISVLITEKAQLLRQIDDIAEEYSDLNAECERKEASLAEASSLLADIQKENAALMEQIKSANALLGAPISEPITLE